MIKLKHTPGPWKYDDDPLRMRIHSEFDHDIVCHMVGNSASSMIQKREIKNANARLIAAAPEMLEDLIDEARKQVIRISAVKNIDEFIKNIGKTKIMQTIEKATGLTIQEVLNEN